MAIKIRLTKLALPDRLALLALGGVGTSAALWLLLSWTDSLLRDTPFHQELFSPAAQQEVVRLSVIVCVLMATLIVQSLFARRYRAEQRYGQLVETSPDLVLILKGGRITFLNSPGAELVGLESAQDALALDLSALIEPEGSQYTPEALVHAIELGDLTGPTHVKLRRADGAQIDLELTARPLRSEGGGSVLCVGRDITERIHAEETIERLAYYDPLTNLPNRRLLHDRLAGALARARRRTERVAVVLVDLDDFKAINDTYGHRVGDGVLQAVGKRIQGLLREEDTVARQGGDEFTVVARIEKRQDAVALADRILAATNQGFKVDGHQLCVTGSIGIATYPDDGEHELDLIRNADAAMYHARDWGHNVCRLYTAEMSHSANDRLELEGALRSAIEHEEFELYYQPQVDVRDGRFIGIEALLRWNHPTRGLLAPGEFIELAEQAGFIGEIGHWVLETACAQAKEWVDEGLEFGHVAVNLSPKEFVQRDIVQSVQGALASSGLTADRLELEITETVAMYNTEQILAILDLLCEMGIRVAIDDFGTGYSSMSYLKRFPIHTLKIAQDFMRDIGVDSQSAAIATMLITLCRELGLDIVAEGVENERQLEFLRDQGCYVIQGYLFSRPVASSDLRDILRRGAAAHWKPGATRRALDLA